MAEVDRDRHYGFARHEVFAGGPGNLALSFGGPERFVIREEGRAYEVGRGPILSVV